MSLKTFFAATALGFSITASAQPATTAAVEPVQPAARSNAPTTPSDVVGVRAALDQHLAESLKDPASASHYSVSEIIPCDAVIEVKGADEQPSSSMCICYRVDAMNAEGANIGGQLNVAMTSSGNGVYGITEIPARSLSATAVGGCKNLSSRDADNIHKLVK